MGKKTEFAYFKINAKRFWYTEKMLNKKCYGLVTILFPQFICIIDYKLTTHNIS